LARLIVEIYSSTKLHKEYKEFDSAIIHVGRGYKNELILTDPYISEDHLVIQATEDGFVVEDLESKNGLYVKKYLKTVKEARLKSGDEIVIGRTTLRVMLPFHPVLPTKFLVRSNRLFKFVNKRLISWSLVIIAAALYLFEGYLAFPNKLQFEKLLPIPIGIIIAVVALAGIWAFIGRLIKHKTRFTAQLGVLSIFIIISININNFSSNTGYYLSSVELEGLLSLTLFLLLCNIILIWNLGLSTNLSKKVRIVVSCCLSLVVLIMTTTFYFAFKDEFVSFPRYHSALKPPFVKILPSKSIDKFVSRNKKVFIFKNKKEKSQKKNFAHIFQKKY